MTPRIIRRVKDKLKEYGADLTRVIFETKKLPQYHNAYSLCDIALDTYPFSGMSICIELALMGVPTVTLVGKGMHSRGVGRINKVLGIEDLNAQNYDEFIEIAKRLSENKERLEYLRNNLCNMIKNSPIISGAQEFTKDLEEKYKTAYEDFINSP